MHMIKTTVVALGILLLAGSTTFAGWYVMPTVVQAYYPGVPVYAYPAPVMAAPVPYVSYMPVAPALAVAARTACRHILRLQ